jgi:hypothetical protein
MGNIKDIVDLAMQLESRAKDRKDIETLRSIISLTHSIQASQAEIVERDLRVMQENSKLVQDKTELERKLAYSQSEDVRIHKGIEFRHGKRTGGIWMGFCPKCHMPAEDAWIPRPRGREKIVQCSARCGWQVFMELNLEAIALEIGK